MRLSQQYADFNSEINIFLPYATANAARLGISDSQLAAVTTAAAEWATQFNLYQDPETHTQRQVETTRTLYKATRSLLSDIQQQVKNNHSVTLTDADLDNMSIHRDAARVGRKLALVAHGAPDPVAADYHAIESSGYGTFNLVWQPEQAHM